MIVVMQSFQIYQKKVFNHSEIKFLQLFHQINLNFQNV